MVVLYRYSTSNHNADTEGSETSAVVLYRYSTSNHNSWWKSLCRTAVVLYRYSTSNHNLRGVKAADVELSYIVILHQTTTTFVVMLGISSCLISLFYIKPQLCVMRTQCTVRCLISLFYIKPQLKACWWEWKIVVLYRYSTSNHNFISDVLKIDVLSYIVILHQTTTKGIYDLLGIALSYIVILHQTTTCR